MNIADLTQAMEELVRSHGWYDPASPKKQLPRNLAISLSLEASEVLEHFQWSEKVNDREALKGELADVALYLLQLANVCEIDLKKAIIEKIQANYSRVWPEDIEGSDQ